jgi:hypothetical protein
LAEKALAGILKITRRYSVWKIDRKAANYDDNSLLCNLLFILFPMQELVERLEQKLRQYRRQMEDAEERIGYSFPWTN